MGGYPDDIRHRPGWRRRARHPESHAENARRCGLGGLGAARGGVVADDRRLVRSPESPVRGELPATAEKGQGYLTGDGLQRIRRASVSVPGVSQAQVAWNLVTGTFWIVSYVVLCFTVLVLTLAVGALFRDIGERTRQGASESSSWPFAAFPSGSALPEALVAAVETTLRVAGDADVISGFCVLATEDEDAFPAAMSVAAVAEHWSTPIVILVERRSGGGWIDKLPPALSERVAYVAGGAFEQLGIHGTPVTSYIRDGLIVEAAPGMLSPSQIEQHFKYVAAPVFSLSSR